ncbi:hypothetical protein FD755_024697 [Muntiacus reevesi]|uniref:NF-kappa-B inhibitor-interacting Ras-like protein 1 n=1 Tax=Muntiacus reevesi TaxID=9886 RepID=A0A5N3UWA7_MUNRE|nr:hypothetical protein FD755_024697 [Muntiacus reevesi]
MAARSSLLAWRILWTEEPGGLLSVGSQRPHEVDAVGTVRLSSTWSFPGGLVVETLPVGSGDKGSLPDLGRRRGAAARAPQVAIVVLGNKIDLSEQRQVDAEVAQQWARSEKVRLWEVTVTDRKTLIEPFTLLASKLSQPQSKSSFPLPGRKNKGNSSSEN